ncbi:MAG: exopolysaccharide biosynthesis protein [Roseibium sp.]
MSRDISTVCGVLDAWESEVRAGPSNVGSILRAAGSRAAGPLLFLPAFVMVSPLGAVPGVPVVLSGLIALVAGQVIAGRRSIWLPSALRDRGIPEEKVEASVETLRPYAGRADRFLGRRLSVLTGEVMTRVVAMLCIVLALLVFPATIVPFAVAFPGSAIILLSLGLLTRDGIVTLAGLAVTAVAIGAVGYLLI